MYTAIARENLEMKVFYKYYAVLPGAALLYGIYLWNFQSETIIAYIDRKIADGWQLLWIIFAVLTAFVVYQLQENKKWEYIYSFPWSKRDIYAKSFWGMHLGALIGGGIYGVFYAVKCFELSKGDSAIHVLLSALLNLLFFLTCCALTEWIIIAAAHVWQGVILAAVFVWFWLPLAVQNVGFIGLSFIGGKEPEAVIVQKVFMNLGGGIRYPLELDQKIFLGTVYGGRTWEIWNNCYIYVLIVCGVGLCLFLAVCLRRSKKQFLKLGVSQNSAFSRLTGLWNRRVAAVVLGILLFHTVTNFILERSIYAGEESASLWIPGIFFVSKTDLMNEGTEQMTKLMKHTSLEQGKAAVLCVLCVAAVQLIIWGLQKIRRKINERVDLL